MKAITISQPYASLIASGVKFVENRSWKTNYRGPIAIHAGKGTQYMSKKQMAERQLPSGCVVATASIQACVNLSWTDTQLYEALPGWCRVWDFLNDKYTEGPWCWIIGDVRRFEYPIVATGKQGIWEWDEKGQTLPELV